MAEGGGDIQATATSEEKVSTITDKLQEVIGLIREEKEENVREILRTEKGLLHEACRIGSVEAVNLLLERDVPISDWNKSFLLPLHLAARNDHREVAEILLEHDPDIIDRPSKFGETPLHFACMKGHLPMVKLLIESKADVRVVDRCDNTTLHYAVSSNNAELVEYLLREKDLLQFINKRNQFHQSPIHRAAILQCVEVIQVLATYRARLNIKDKNGLTALDLSTILYGNERVELSDDGMRKREFIIPPSFLNSHFSPAPSVSDQHSRSSSFSYYRPSFQSMTDSTTSLPVSAGIQKKRPSATQAKRPVNLSFSQNYSRQASANSSQGSRGSEIYLKDKEQAEKLSEALDKESSMNDLEKIVLDQTSYEPPIDMSFVLPVESFTLHSEQCRFQSKEHDIQLKISEKYWILDSSETLDCKLAASLHWNRAYPTGYIFVSPICFLSCRSRRPYEVKLTLPHALHFPSEKHHKRISVFFTNTVNLEEGILSPSVREFRRVATSDLVVDTHYVSFTTSIKYPSLFAVGVASTPSNKGGLSTMYPLFPMRCCLYVACPSDREQYVTNTDILIYVAMNLKTVEMAMKSHVIPNGFTLEEKGFVLSGQVLKVHGRSENEQWQVSKRGSGHFRYNQVALSQETEQESTMTHQQTYPSREAFFVECHDPDKVLKCRVSVECEGNELVNMLITPYTPVKQVPTLDPFLLKESFNLPQDMNSSSESIPLRTSSV